LDSIFTIDAKLTKKLRDLENKAGKGFWTAEAAIDSILIALSGYSMDYFLSGDSYVD
jgi:hypothetical protein